MNLDRDVFLSILALDSYNRGYEEGLSGLPVSGLIGTAQVKTDALEELNSDLVIESGFYGIAYQLGGETIISYRGTSFDGAPGRKGRGRKRQRLVEKGSAQNARPTATPNTIASSASDRS